MNKLLLLLLPLLLATGYATAQNDHRSNHRPPHERGERGNPEHRAARFAKIRAARKAFITEELALTEKETAAFFPVYWMYDEKLRTSIRSSVKLRKDSAANVELAEAEARQLLLINRASRQETLALRNEMEDKLLTILPATKIIRLSEIEKEFRSKLWNRARGRWGGLR